MDEYRRLVSVSRHLKPQRHKMFPPVKAGFANGSLFNCLSLFLSDKAQISFFLSENIISVKDGHGLSKITRLGEKRN